MIKKILILLILLNSKFVFSLDRPQVIEQTRSLNSQQKFIAAQKIYLNYLRTNPKDIEIMFMLANSYAWNKQYKEANKYYKKATIIKPDYLPAYLGSVKILAWSEKYEEALKELKKLTRKFKKNPSIYNQMAKIYSWQKDIKKALAYYKASYRINPRNTETLEGLARIYRWLGMNTKQLLILRRLMKDNPSNYDYVYHAAIAYRNQKNVEKSLKYFRRAKSLPGADQKKIDAEILFTRTLLEQNRQESVQLKKNVALDKSDVEEFIRQGRVYSWQKKNDDAIKLFRQALKKSPRHIDALLGLGNTYYFSGQWDDALSVFRRADRIKPNDPLIEGNIEKVEKLMRPYFSTQYRMFTFDDKIETDTVSFTQESVLSRYSLIYRQSLSSKLNLRGEMNLDRTSNKDSDLNFENFQIDSRNVAFEVNYNFGFLDYRLKLFYNNYKDVNENENLFLLGEEESNFSGYTLVRKEIGKHFLSLSFAREYALIPRAADFSVIFYEIDTLDLLDSVEFSDQFTTSFGIRRSRTSAIDRTFHVYSVRPLYRPKQLENWEFSLEYQSWEENNAPDFSNTTLSTTWYKNFEKVFFDITTLLSYTGFDDTYFHDTRLTLSYQLPFYQLVLRTELSYLYEFKGDKDKSSSILVDFGRAF